MPYSSEHRATTRARIVESARRLFNRQGFDQVSIEQVMAGAGLTHGGFYHHFTSKDALYAEAVASFATNNPSRQHMTGMTNDPLRLARTLVDLYLSDAVLDDMDAHCPLYALPNDVARAGPTARQAYTGLIRNLTRMFGDALAQVRDGAHRAEAIVALCVGGMVLASTTDDPVLRRTLREAARKQALDMLEVEVEQGHTGSGI